MSPGVVFYSTSSSTGVCWDGLNSHDVTCFTAGCCIGLVNKSVQPCAKQVRSPHCPCMSFSGFNKDDKNKSGFSMNSSGSFNQVNPSAQGTGQQTAQPSGQGISAFGSLNNQTAQLSGQGISAFGSLNNQTTQPSGQGISAFGSLNNQTAQPFGTATGTAQPFSSQSTNFETQTMPNQGFLGQSSSIFSNLSKDSKPAFAFQSDGSPLSSKTQSLQQSNPFKKDETAGHVSVKLPSDLKNKTVGQIIDEWNKELQEQVKEYKTLSFEVVSVDKQVIENEQKIKALKEEMQKTLEAKKELETGLEQIAQQQKNLENLLNDVEVELQEIYDKKAENVAGASGDRQTIYTKISEISKETSELTDLLSEITKNLSMFEDESESPMVEIARVLDEQLDSLQCADDLIEKLKQEVAALKNSNTVEQRRYL